MDTMGVAGQIYRKLDALGIAYQTVSHPAAHTIEDCQVAQERLHAVVAKNLFLAPRNLSSFYLCLTHPQSVFRTKDVSKQVGSSRLSFGPEEPLFALLRTYPGAISPMGLVFPESKDVMLLADERLKGVPRLAFHPNDNTKTLAMTNHDFFSVFLPATGHAVRWVLMGEGIPGLEESPLM
jgi:Ala-tRNA(Pro) deacylase